VLVAACSNGKPKETATADDAGELPDFSDVSPEACACDDSCKLADFDCKAACDAPEGACRDACDESYADCAVACNGCITLFTLCYKLCSDKPGCAKQCDEGLPICQKACGWDMACLDQCDAADLQCYDQCDSAWDCYRTDCMPATKDCYAQCF
jgi:hypothetical protein